jgi:glutamate racemase
VQGALFASVVERFAQGVTVLRQACPGLVRQIEAGEFDTPRTEAMLHGWLDPMVERNIDALVLGCTHYPLIRPLIQRIVGDGVRVIDPAPAIARRVESILKDDGNLARGDEEGGLTCYTSGPAGTFQAILDRIGLESDGVHQTPWQADGTLVLS